MDAGKFAVWLCLAALCLFALVVVEPELFSVLPSWLRAYKPEVESVRRSAAALLLTGAALGWMARKVTRAE